MKETNEQVEEFLLDEKYKEILYQYQDTLKRIANPERRLIFTIEDISLIDMISD